MYVCLAYVHDGFLNGCRKYIRLDACFLKGEVKGMLLMVVGKDPNNQMFPLAWAIVETESQSLWRFLKHLKIDIKTIDGQECTFMSDKQKNYSHKLNTQLMCTLYIYANWYSDIHGEQLKMAFYSVAKCVNEAQMHQSCGAWQLLGIPCSHAIAAIKSRARDPFDYLDNYYSKESNEPKKSRDAFTLNDASAAGRKRKKPLKKTTLKPTNMLL
nr:hypothetical protein [Tanacetum cinerariifolium]